MYLFLNSRGYIYISIMRSWYWVHRRRICLRVCILASLYFDILSPRSLCNAPRPPCLAACHMLSGTVWRQPCWPLPTASYALK